MNHSEAASKFYNEPNGLSVAADCSIPTGTRIHYMKNAFVSLWDHFQNMNLDDVPLVWEHLKPILDRDEKDYAFESDATIYELYTKKYAELSHRVGYFIILAKQNV